MAHEITKRHKRVFRKWWRLLSLEEKLRFKDCFNEDFMVEWQANEMERATPAFELEEEEQITVRRGRREAGGRSKS